MSSRIALVVVLAEDLRSARFLRKYVERALDTREIRLEITRSGAGDQWVRERYPIEVREQRRRVHGYNHNAALVVHTDADTTATEARYDQLAKALSSNEQTPRAQDELITVVVPKQNTETWLHGLCGASVVEDYDYKRDPERRLNKNHDSRIAPAAKALFDLTRPNADDPPRGLPALKRAIPELRRLE